MIDLLPDNRRLAGFKSDPNVDPIQRLVTGMVSTVDVDMVGDVVLPEGMDVDTYFTNTRSVDLDHDSDKAVGTNRAIKKVPGKGVYTSTYVGTHMLGQDVMTMIQEGIIRGLSIEWDNRTLVAGPPTPDELKRYGQCKRVFREWTLTAYAFTPRPMNQNALIDGVKSAKYLDAANAIWEQMRGLVDAGKIHPASAKSAGLPEQMLARKLFPVTGKAVVSSAARRVADIESGLVFNIPAR